MAPIPANHRITDFLEVPDYVTLAGMFAGLTSIFASLEGHLAAASVLIVFSIACDFFDGRIARKMGREGEFGTQLDCFNDLLTSVVSVSVFGYCAGLESPLAIGCMVLFCTAGALRLSRYAITGTVDGYYEGVPVTFGLSVPIGYWASTALGLPIGWLAALYAVGSFLMISTIRIKKP